jgi:hypothetical protein
MNAKEIEIPLWYNLANEFTLMKFNMKLITLISKVWICWDFRYLIGWFSPFLVGNISESSPSCIHL